MAALNTLRTKGSILLTAVIGISLLAFLLGDGTSLFNKTSITVGTVDGKEISLKSYSTEVDLATSIRKFMTQQSSISQQETEMLQAQVWNQMISDIVLTPTYKELGLAVSDDELLDMVNGVYISPVVMQIFSDPQTGSFDKERATQFVANLDADQSGMARQFWAFVEKQSADTRMSQKFNDLVKAGSYVTSLQVDQALVNNEYDYSIDYVTKAISSIADDAVTVTDQDLKAYYTKHIDRFKYEDASEVEYVTFDILPSDQDYAEAEENATKVAAEFAGSEEIEEYVNYTSEEKFNPTYRRVDELPAYLQPLLAEAEMGKTFTPNFENGIYSIARLKDSKVVPDSITLKSVYVDGANNVDSIVNVIKAGGFNDIVAKYSMANGADSEAVTVSTSALAPLFADKLLSAKKGDVLTFDVRGAKQIVSVVSVGNNVKKYQVAEIKLTVTPSSKTEQDIYAKASGFINEINGGKSFEDALTGHQYIKRTFTVNPAHRLFANLENSRELVRWAFTSKEGTLSHVVTAGNVNVVAYVKRKMEKGAAPFEAVKEDIRPLYVAKVKMDMAVKDLSGAASLEDLASKVGGEIATATDLNFAMNSIPGIGMAPEVIGALTSIAEGTIVAVPAGTSAAAVKITSKVKNETLDAAKMRVMLETSTYSSLEEQIAYALSRKIDVRDSRVVYY